MSRRQVRIDPTVRLERDLLIGGEPFAIVRGRLSDRELIMRNLAQPEPAGPLVPVSVVIPVRDRPAALARALAAVESDDVIVVDDASRDAAAIRAAAGGARVLRHAHRRGAGAARNTGLAAARHELVALLDSDCVPRPGWLEALVPHFEDPELGAVAPRIVALGHEGVLGRYEARHSPLDRGPLPARVIPGGRVPFVPGAALVVRRHLRFDETLRGGEDVDFCWRVPYVRYEPAGQVAHAHRTSPGAWFARRVYYGRTSAPLARRHPGNARPLRVDPWTTAAYVALALKRPGAAVAITATATALLARELPWRTAARIAGLGTLRSHRVVADAIRRAWWPLAPRRVLIAAILADPRPLRLADDFAYSLGVFIGCVEHRTLDPLLPARPWRLERF